MLAHVIHARAVGPTRCCCQPDVPPSVPAQETLTSQAHTLSGPVTITQIQMNTHSSTTQTQCAHSQQPACMDSHTSTKCTQTLKSAGTGRHAHSEHTNRINKATGRRVITTKQHPHTAAHVPALRCCNGRGCRLRRPSLPDVHTETLSKQTLPVETFQPAA